MFIRGSGLAADRGQPLGAVSKRKFEAGIRQLVVGQGMLERSLSRCCGPEPGSAAWRIRWLADYNASSTPGRQAPNAFETDQHSMRSSIKHILPPM